MGIPLRSASTMSLPEGTSCEGGLLDHPSEPGLSPQIGLCPHTGPPSSDWISPLVWAFPIRLGPACILGLSPQIGPPPSHWVLHLRMEPPFIPGPLPHAGPLTPDWTFLVCLNLTFTLDLPPQTGCPPSAGPPLSDCTV